jgi:hypothetical protein
VKIVLTLLMALFAMSSVHAQGTKLTICDVCAGAQFTKKGNDVIWRCPGMKEPYMVFKDCLNPKVERNKDGSVKSLTCSLPYTVPPPPQQAQQS